MAETTKKALAASLKKLLSERPLSKITIADIAEDCEVNRQTFYYHFHDIYDLLEWIYTNDATKTLGDKKSHDSWQTGFLRIFRYVLENKAFVKNTYHSVSREYLERYLYNETYNLLINVVDELSVGMSVREEDKKFIADFYKFGFVGLVMEWINNGMKEEPARLVGRLGVLIENTFGEALNRFQNHL